MEVGRAAEGARQQEQAEAGGDDYDDMGGELDAFRLEQQLEALEKERCNLKEEVDEGRHQMQAMKETTIQGGSGEIPDSQFKIAV